MTASRPAPLATPPATDAAVPAGVPARRPVRRLTALLLALATALVALVGLVSSPASAAVPTACASATTSLPRITGATFTGYGSARCNQYYFLRTQVKENGVVIRDNYQSQWQQPWASSGIYTTPNFSCLSGRTYQAVTLVYFWNGSSSYAAGYWTTGSPRTLC